MARISDVLNIARRALNVQRTALNITGHNIANANTEGYTRKRVTMSSTIPLRTTEGMLGTGVYIATSAAYATHSSMRRLYQRITVWGGGNTVREFLANSKLLLQNHQNIVWGLSSLSFGIAGKIWRIIPRVLQFDRLYASVRIHSLQR